MNIEEINDIVSILGPQFDNLENIDIIVGGEYFEIKEVEEVGSQVQNMFSAGVLRYGITEEVEADIRKNITAIQSTNKSISRYSILLKRIDDINGYYKWDDYKRRKYKIGSQNKSITLSFSNIYTLVGYSLSDAECLSVFLESAGCNLLLNYDELRKR